MLKFAGILMILLQGPAWGLQRVWSLQKRAESEKFLWLTSCLKGTVRCGNSCFPEAFLEISEKFDGMYQEFLQSLADRLKGQEGQTLGQISGTVQKRVPDRRFSAEEMELIASLGDRLGYLDREMQLRQLDVLRKSCAGGWIFWPASFRKKETMPESGDSGRDFLGVLLW